MPEAFRGVDVVRVRDGVRSADRDRAATEEPLEVRLHNQPFAVIMRTPGADRELAAGFLLAEGVLKSADDLGTIEYCTDPSAEHPENIVNARLMNGSPEALDALLAERRNVTTNSSCGLCGRLTIESLRTNLPPLTASWSVPAATVLELPDRLRQAQAVFEETGGLHAAGLFTREGRLETVAEDVGRHNAVDKVDRPDADGRAAAVVESPAVCQRPDVVRDRPEGVYRRHSALVCAVSAPSSLAVELAEDCGMTLIGFLRGRNFNIYTHPERVTN